MADGRALKAPDERRGPDLFRLIADRPPAAVHPCAPVVGPGKPVVLATRAGVGAGVALFTTTLRIRAGVERGDQGKGGNKCDDDFLEHLRGS